MTIDEAVLILAGRRAVSKSGSKALSGLHITPTDDGRTVVLQCDGHVVKAELEPGASFEEAVMTCWDKLQTAKAPTPPRNPLQWMTTVGRA
jgi:hypothetical protein